VYKRQRFIRTSTIPALAAVLCLSLAGCQTPPQGAAATLTADPSDPCQAERTDFATSKTYFQDQIVSSVVAGAATGAVGGALIGGLATGNWRGALIGAAAGGVMGGVASGTSAYYNTLAQKAQDQNELAANMSQDLSHESQEIDHTAVTFGRLRACRFGQARFVKDQARSHIIDRPTALARIAYHRDKFDQELAVAHEMGLTMAKRSQQFQQAANDLKTHPPVNAQGAPVARAAPVKVAQVDKAATVSVPEKRASFDRTVASAESNKQAAFNLDSNASLSWLLLNGFDA